MFNPSYPIFNMHRGVTPISHDIYFLHMTIFYICVVIGIIVFGVLIGAIIFHRKSRGVKPANFHENHLLEITWAIIPLLILVVMALPATIVLFRMNDTSKSDVTIKITGYQWKWKYEYLDQGISFFSNLATPYEQINNQAPKGAWYLLEVDKPLVLPINKKIRFLVTSNDVIHSWWVPDLGIKRDGIPGFINESWARITVPGVYRGQCAELCGLNHGFMPIVVIAKTESDFDAWVAASRKETPAALTNMNFADLMKLGESVYNKVCAACHQPNGLGIPNTFPPLKASSIAVGKPISRHIDRVLNGVPGTAMQAFGTQLSDTEIAAVITYERNAWGNNTGDVVQPTDIAKERERLKTEPDANTMK